MWGFVFFPLKLRFNFAIWRRLKWVGLDGNGIKEFLYF